LGQWESGIVFQTFSTALEKHDPSISLDMQPTSQSITDGDTDTSLVATLVNSTFPEKCEMKWDSLAPSIFSDKPLKIVEKIVKFQKQ
jgi:hypothetical protein